MPWRDYGLGGYAGYFPEFLEINVRNRPMLTAKADFDHLPAVGFVYRGFTPEEIDAKVDLETLMQDTFKEHTLKFVIGQNDINSDADWEAYLAALEKAGPAEYGRVYQAAWNRAPFFLTRTAGIGATEPLQPSRTDPGASRARHGLIDAGSPCGLAGSEPLRFAPAFLNQRLSEPRWRRACSARSHCRAR